MEREGEVTIRQVDLGEPTTLPRFFHRRLNRFVTKRNVRKKIIHVAREVDTDARLLVLFNDDVKRLDVSRRRRRREALHCVESEILFQACVHCRLMSMDREGIFQYGWKRRMRVEREVNPFLDVRANRIQLAARKE